MAAAQELVALANQLNAFAGQIDKYIDAQPNPYAPAFGSLRAVEAQIAGAANQVAGLAIALLAPDIANATQNLTSNVNAAQNVLQTIQDVQQAAQIVAGVLAVAVAAATGNPFSAASSVAQLGSQLQAVLT